MSRNVAARAALFTLGALMWWIAWPAAAQAQAQVPAPAKVMFIGLWHFDNPGLDAVKYTPIDVMKPAEQAYLVALAKRIADFRPTRILLEYPAERDALINQRYQDWLAGRFELPVNEIYQLGFRIAKEAGLKRVEGFDVRDVKGDDSIWPHLMQDPALSKEFGAMIADMSKRLTHMHKTMDMKALLRRNNHPDEDRENKSFYLWLNPIGTEAAPHMGSNASTQWWQRNFRMYALVQKAAQPGERVVVIAGQGHTAVMRDFLRADLKRVEEHPDAYF
ncbi:MAG: DUF5694 domain-containing protein [Burkholderiales bacterium]|nr:DUF5694 domain-containing protein [Burkholderiales bacterium]